jgi:GAF domain-containing protein
LQARLNASLAAKRLRDQEVSYLRQIQKEKKRADDLLNVVIPIGVALSAERNFDHLLEKALLEAMSFCNADAGALYLRTEEDRLEFVIVRNNSLNIAMGGPSGQEISFSPLHLYDKTTGEPNHRNIVTHTTLSNTSVNIPDAYRVRDFDFSGPKAFDAETGYRSTSFLTVPLKNSFNHVIGVLQLINAQATETGQVIPFDKNLQQMVESMSLLAAVALEAYIREQDLRQEIQRLHIEIDEAKRKREVIQITETEYFHQLQSKAKKLKKAMKGNR